MAVGLLKKIALAISLGIMPLVNLYKIEIRTRKSTVNHAIV